MVSCSEQRADDERLHWQARIALGFERRNGRTALVLRRHQGPLRVQRPFYPEGDCCHVYLLHPPGGVVGGDRLSIDVETASDCQVVITTPGAGKFYRSVGQVAEQDIQLKVAEGATLEWLPQETIVYQGAQLNSGINVELSDSCAFIGWEIFALGRPAAGEEFNSGVINTRWSVRCNNDPVMNERLMVNARVWQAKWGLKRQTAFGSLLVWKAGDNSLQAVRDLISTQSGCAVTLLDDLLVCRAVASQTSEIRSFFEAVRKLVRQDLIGLEHCTPRIWAT